MEFLYLPRLDLRDPHDSRITDTVAVVEARLSRRTRNGTAYYRYGVDGHRVGDTGVVWVPQVQPRQVEELHADQGGGLNSIDSGPPGWLPTPTRSPPGS